jgi:hypothetical protein
LAGSSTAGLGVMGLLDAEGAAAIKTSNPPWERPPQGGLSIFVAANQQTSHFTPNK